MTASELLTILTRLPHDAYIYIEHNGEQLEPATATAEMSPDLYSQRDHVIIKLSDE